MRRKKIGTFHFGGKVEITDPGYDKENWCRMDRTVSNGEYTCYIWKEKRDSDTIVGVVGIYRDGFIPAQRSMKEIGSIGVDSGLAGFFVDKPDFSDAEWKKFIEITKTGDAWISEYGFFSSTGFGDGDYPVYSYEKNGEILALEIRFL